jgi:hypothetical protein
LINDYATFLRLLASLGWHQAGQPGRISATCRVTLKLSGHPNLGLRVLAVAISGKPFAS